MSPLAVLPSPVLWRVSSPSRSRAALPQPVVQCAPAPPGQGVTAGGYRCGAPGGTLRGADAHRAFQLPIRLQTLIHLHQHTQVV